MLVGDRFSGWLFALFFPRCMSLRGDALCRDGFFQALREVRAKGCFACVLITNVLLCKRRFMLVSHTHHTVLFSHTRQRLDVFINYSLRLWLCYPRSRHLFLAWYSVLICCALLSINKMSKLVKLKKV